MSISYQKTAPITIVRASNTTAYSAGQVINGNGSTSMITVPLNKGNHQSGFIVSGQAIDSVAQSSLKFDVLFFSKSFAIPADGSAFNPSLANMQQYYLGRMSFSSFTALSGISICDGTTPSTNPIITQVSDSKLFCVLVATGSYTPASGETISLKLDFEVL